MYVNNTLCDENTCIKEESDKIHWNNFIRGQAVKEEVQTKKKKALYFKTTQKKIKKIRTEM